MPSPALPWPAYRFESIDAERIRLPEALVPIVGDDEDASLADNLRRFGFIQPLPVWQQTGHYLLLAGYPFLRAIRSLALSRVPCLILPPETAPLTLYLLQIQHGLSALPTSPILQAHLLQQARQNLSQEEVLLLLAAMGHKPHHAKLKELTGLLQLDPLAVRALHHGVLSPKSGKQLALLSQEDQRPLVELVRTYRPGGSKQQKLVEWVIELSLRHHRPVRDILQPWLTGRQAPDPSNIPQQLQKLLLALQEQYAPEKSGAEKTFQRQVHELQPPEGVSIEHSPAFEDDSVEVRLRFSDLDSLKQHWPAITSLTTDR
jgi:ParB family chromosome partitioning protein